MTFITWLRTQRLAKCDILQKDLNFHSTSKHLTSCFPKTHLTKHNDILQKYGIYKKTRISQTKNIYILQKADFVKIQFFVKVMRSHIVPSFCNTAEQNLFLYSHIHTVLWRRPPGKSGRSEDSICHMLTLYSYYLMHRSGINTISPDHYKSAL